MVAPRAVGHPIAYACELRRTQLIMNTLRPLQYWLPDFCEGTWVANICSVYSTGVAVKRGPPIPISLGLGGPIQLGLYRDPMVPIFLGLQGPVSDMGTPQFSKLQPYSETVTSTITHS